MKKTTNTTGRRMNALFALSITLLVVVFILLNAVALVLSNRFPLSLDLTANAAYNIGEETKTMLDHLVRPVTIDILAPEQMFSGDAYLVQTKKILKQYERHSSRVTVHYIDYAADPSYAATRPDLKLSEGDLIISSGDRVKQIPLSSLFNYTPTASGSIVIESSRAEETITSAIMNVLSGDDVRCGVLVGNGGPEAEAFTTLLVNNHYVLQNAVPATDDLSDFDALFLFAPQNDLSADDIRALDAFLYNDGNYGKTLFYTASVTQASLPMIESFLAEWGVTVGEGSVFETTPERTYQRQPFYAIADFAETHYRDMLVDPNAPMLMPLARPLKTIFTVRDHQFTETLLTFGETAAVRPPNASDDFTADDATERGPFPALVLASRRFYKDGLLARQSSIVVSSSHHMLEPIALHNTSLSNSAYLLNMMNDLTGREEGPAITPKSLAGKTLGATSSQVTRLGVVLGGIIPLAILLTGIGVWLYRRYQ
ncbi:MAG TPA: Gldg family protein [Bacillota bacterium]|nr:Gldg family protein [Bacillota bacterium]HQC49097.1 Gldg family protein [Bacillota bacterium]